MKQKKEVVRAMCDNRAYLIFNKALYQRKEALQIAKRYFHEAPKNLKVGNANKTGKDDYLVELLKGSYWAVRRK